MSGKNFLYLQMQESLSLFCDDHFVDHVKTPGDHVTECVIVELDPNQTRELIPKLKDLIEYSRRCRKRIMNNAIILINCIEKDTWRALNSIKELERASADLITERMISKENYERIQSFNIDDKDYTSYGVKTIAKNISGLYEFYNGKEEFWKECNQVIFSRADRLEAIDLNTFKSSVLKYSPVIAKFCGACKLDENTYFFHGGRNDSITLDSAYLINIKDENYEAVNNGPKKCNFGSVLKDNKVYIFGGRNEANNVTNESYVLDLKTKEWNSITALPEASSSITAAILGKYIILSGMKLSCCYSYNDSTFTNILTLPGSISKIVCEGWIYANSILYENQDQIPSKWTFYNVNPWNNFLWTSCVFKNNKFIYFIDNSNCLMRIDTKLKKVDRIIFT